MQSYIWVVDFLKRRGRRSTVKYIFLIYYSNLELF